MKKIIYFILPLIVGTISGGITLLCMYYAIEIILPEHKLNLADSFLFGWFSNGSFQFGLQKCENYLKN